MHGTRRISGLWVMSFVAALVCAAATFGGQRAASIPASARSNARIRGSTRFCRPTPMEQLADGLRLVRGAGVGQGRRLPAVLRHPAQHVMKWKEGEGDQPVPEAVAATPAWSTTVAEPGTNGLMLDPRRPAGRSASTATAASRGSEKDGGKRHAGRQLRRQAAQQPQRPRASSPTATCTSPIRPMACPSRTGRPGEGARFLRRLSPRRPTAR